MAKATRPRPNLCQKAPPRAIVLYLLWLASTLPLPLFCVGFSVWGLIGIPIFSTTTIISVTPQAIYLYLIMASFGVTWFRLGYTSAIPRTKGKTKEELAAEIKLMLHALAQEATIPLVGKKPVPELAEKWLRLLKPRFVTYLADPYSVDGCNLMPLFSRRCHIYHMGALLLLSTPVASLPFSKLVGQTPETNRIYEHWAFIWQGVACLLVVYWWYRSRIVFCVTAWMLRMGAIARQIRQECFELGSVKVLGKERNEKLSTTETPEDTLEWWISEIWEGCEGEKGDSAV